MLGKLHELYLKLSQKRESVDAEDGPAPWGHVFGQIVQSAQDAVELAREQVEQTAEDLGYE